MAEAVVVGGGWAGLSAAVELAERGCRVTLLEQSGRLGGRASSFRDDDSGDVVDNGQHLFMGCYTHTLSFLRKIEALPHLKFQDGLSVDFIDRNGTLSTLRCPPLPAPLHLFGGLLRLSTLSLAEKLAVVRVYRALRRSGKEDRLESISVKDWLASLGQSEHSRKAFWDLITLATLNEQPEIAQAASLAVVLKEAFFAGKSQSRLALAAVGLSDLCGPGSRQFVEKRGGRLLTHQLVSKIRIENGRATGVTLRDGSRIDADVCLCAVPHFVLPGLLPDPLMQDAFFSGIRNLRSSPIFSISLWFDRPITDRRFAGLLETETQWLFNKRKIFVRDISHECVSLVISGAHKHLAATNDQLLKLCLGELRQCFPASAQAKLIHFLIQREKNATLSPAVGSDAFRPSQKTPVRNLFLCGDWTDTGLPATIESAVASGVKAAAFATEAA